MLIFSSKHSTLYLYNLLAFRRSQYFFFVSRKSDSNRKLCKFFVWIEHTLNLKSVEIRARPRDDNSIGWRCPAPAMYVRNTQFTSEIIDKRRNWNWLSHFKWLVIVNKSVVREDNRWVRERRTNLFVLQGRKRKTLDTGNLSSFQLNGGEQKKKREINANIKTSLRTGLVSRLAASFRWLLLFAVIIGLIVTVALAVSVKCAAKKGRRQRRRRLVAIYLLWTPQWCQAKVLVWVRWLYAL